MMSATNMPTPAVAFSGVASCVSLSIQILELLATSKGNKHEFRSLSVAVQSIHTFLVQLPKDGITPEGNTVLEQLYHALDSARRLLVRVQSMGPLMSLIRATLVRDDFLRIKWDVTAIFGILAAGEQLLSLSQTRTVQVQQAQQIKQQLQNADDGFFVKEQAALHKLQDVAAAAKQGSWPEQELQRKLLQQLRMLPEVSELSHDQLLEEYRSLQLMAMYNGAAGPTAGNQAGAVGGLPPGAPAGDAAAAADDAPAAGASFDQHGPGGKAGKKGVSSELEEFLLQQVCAALAPTVAANTKGTLLPAGAVPQPPAEFLCPISCEVMVHPVVIKTGKTYEAANIHRWLDTHSTCPVTGQKVAGKQMVVNQALKSMIEDWAQQHNIALPPAPAYTSLRTTLSDGAGSGNGPSALVLPVATATAAAAAGPTASVTAAAAPSAVDQGKPCNSSATIAAAAVAGKCGPGGQQQVNTAQVVVEMPPYCRTSTGSASTGGSGGSSGGKAKAACGCTRTKWALLAAALVLVCAGVAAGAGGYFAVKARKGPTAPPPAVGPAAPDRTGFLVALRSEVTGLDFDCGQPGHAGYCELCNTTLTAIANKCLELQGCGAFVYNEATACGYLKGSATGIKANPTNILFCVEWRGFNCHSTAGSAKLRFNPGQDVPNNDYSCPAPEVNGAPRCTERINTLGDMCLQDTRCKAFSTTELREPGSAAPAGHVKAFFKSAAGPRSSVPNMNLFSRVEQ